MVYWRRRTLVAGVVVCELGPAVVGGGWRRFSRGRGRRTAAGAAFAAPLAAGVAAADAAHETPDDAEQDEAADDDSNDSRPSTYKIAN